MKYHDDTTQASDLLQNQLCKNVLAKVTLGTKNVSEEINVISQYALQAGL